MSNMSMFGDILRGVAGQVATSALNELAHRAAAYDESHTVDEITGESSQRTLFTHENTKGCTEFQLACMNNNVVLVKELINEDPKQLQITDKRDGSNPLHWASGHETLSALLELGCDSNLPNNLGITPLHKSVERGCLKSTLTLLCHGAFPDLKGVNGDTAIHIASQLCLKTIMQALIVFGADINMENSNGETPRHLVCTSEQNAKEKVLFILHSVGAKRCAESKEEDCVEGCKFSGTFEGIQPDNFPDHMDFDLLHDALFSFNIKKSSEELKSGEIGGRLLCLDGGGIRGIVLTQMLAVMQEEFGCPVIDLFDWVAGTSTGGILALALACKKSALETQGIYLRLKDKVFIGERPYSAALMGEFLKKEFGTDTKIDSIKTPRVMVMTALVDRRPTDLHIIRNYASPRAMMGLVDVIPQNLENQLVWETAKVSGAAPSYFRLDHNQCVDGGLIANNPTLDALVELQQFATAKKSLGDGGLTKIPTTVVSLGTGLQPKTHSNVSLLDISWPTGILDAITTVPRLFSLVNLLIDQATQSEGQVVERSRAWCSEIGCPFFRFSPQMSSFIDLDETDDAKLVNLLWETRCYMITNRDKILEMKEVLFRK